MAHGGLGSAGGVGGRGVGGGGKGQDFLGFGILSCGLECLIMVEGSGAIEAFGLGASSEDLKALNSGGGPH